MVEEEGVAVELLLNISMAAQTLRVDGNIPLLAVGDGGGDQRTANAVGVAGRDGVLRQVAHGRGRTVGGVLGDCDGHLLLRSDGSSSTGREGSDSERETHFEC